jgi:hypothetical protein
VKGGRRLKLQTELLRIKISLATTKRDLTECKVIWIMKIGLFGGKHGSKISAGD